MWQTGNFGNLLLMIRNGNAIGINARQRFHINMNVNPGTLTKPDNMLYCFVQLSFNGYSKTVFDLKIASDSCHSKLRICKIMIIKILLANTYGRWRG